MAAGYVSAYASLFISVFVQFFLGPQIFGPNLFFERNCYISFNFCKVSDKSEPE